MKYMFIAILIMLSPTVRAEGGKSYPLAIEFSSIMDGETNVETNREIKFVFSKNISNNTVKKGNLACFILTDSSGAPVPIKTILFDDQLERDRRNDVIIKPEALNEAEQYTLAIKGNLEAKNGASLEKDILLTFSTPGYQTIDGGKQKTTAVRITAILLIGVGVGFFMKRRNAR